MSPIQNTEDKDESYIAFMRTHNRTTQKTIKNMSNMGPT